ncbi:MAG: hypothetical protein AABX30_01860 [Nanoarchaeota archaeon]
MKLSNEKREKISEQILQIIFIKSPKSLFTSEIAKEIARDEEFIKDLLEDLQSKKLIIKITKNPKGFTYLRRARWRLSDAIYNHYRNNQ